MDAVLAGQLIAALEFARQDARHDDNLDNIEVILERVNKYKQFLIAETI